MKRRLHMVYEKKTYHLSSIERFRFLNGDRLLQGVFVGLHGWARFLSTLFCVYRSNSLVGGQGVGAEQTVALRCMRAFGVVAGVGRSYLV